MAMVERGSAASFSPMAGDWTRNSRVSCERRFTKSGWTMKTRRVRSGSRGMRLGRVSARSKSTWKSVALTAWKGQLFQIYCYDQGNLRTLSLSGNPISARQAQDHGLVDRVVDGDTNLLGAALEYARVLISDNAPLRSCAHIAVDQSEIDDDFFDQVRNRIAAKTAGQKILFFFCVSALGNGIILKLSAS